STECPPTKRNLPCQVREPVSQNPAVWQLLAVPPQFQTFQSVGGTDWKGGWHRLERWVAPIGEMDAGKIAML
ncbi:MAG: hypothetical protein ACK5ZC_07465, partial [Pirellulaceae bacterium]